MTHADTHAGSRPEDRFDHWLDALVAGTPADAASLDGTDGSLARAVSGARQLHGLAARETPAWAAQRRIEEDLMRSGTLAAPRGTTWIPIEKEARRAPWWSPASPVIAWALIVALIVALGASFIASQRPAPTPTDAPGFALASPGADEPTPVASLPIVKGEPDDELRSRLGSYGVIDDAGLSITRPGADDLEFPGVVSVMPNGVPGEAVLTRDDGTRFVADLTTGETRFDLPDTSGSESQAGTYLFVSEPGENADWIIYDLRTGDSRPLSEIVDLPADQPVIVTPSGQLPTDSPTVVMQFLTDERDPLDPGAYPSFLIAGSLDRIVTLDGYPPAGEERTGAPVVSPDGTRAAWIATDPRDAVVVADTTTGDELARFDIDDFHAEPSLGGFTSDGEHLVVLTHASAFLIDWSDNEPEMRVIADTAGYAFNPLLYVPTNTLYYQEGESLLRMTVPEGEITTVIDGGLSRMGAPALPTMFAAPGSPWMFANLDTGFALVDARTGDVVSRISDMPTNTDPFVGMALSTSIDGSTIVQGIGGSASGYLVSPRFPDGLVLTAPVDPDVIAASQSPDSIPVHYTLSPSGSSVLASVFDESSSHPAFVAEIGPDPEWTPIDPRVTMLYWLPMPASDDDSSDAVTLPAQDFATPAASPAAGASCATTPPNGDIPPGENAGLDWLGSGSDDQSLWLMMTWDDGTIETDAVAGGYPVKLTFWRGEGSGEITVTASGPDDETLPAGAFAPFQGDPIPGLHPFGGTLPEAGCWTFTATDGNDTLTWTVDVRPMSVTSISVTAEADISVSVTADGVEVYDGQIAAGDTAGPFEGSHIEVLTSSGRDTRFTNACGDPPFSMGDEPRDAYYIFKADASSCPPEATPAASPSASPVAASAPDAVMVVEGTAAEARVENNIAIATLGDDGLTLPVGGETVTLPGVTQVKDIGPDATDALHIIRDDGSEAVIDLATGDVLFELPPFQNWTREFGRWRFVPTDETLTDWTVTDLATGDTRLLSELIDLPGDSAVMPSPIDETRTGASSVYRIELGRPENTGWVTTDPAARTFVVAGSLDRVAALPDYPTARDNVGSPTLVASDDGATVAYETRAGDSRIVVLDVTSTKVLARASASKIGENPTLAGFDAGGRVIVTDGTRLLALDPATDGASTVADGFERLDNPLVRALSSTVYARDIDRLLRIDLESGKVTEVASGLLPAAFGFTTPGGNWIVAQTRDGFIMVDARTGEIVSRMQPDPTRASFVLPEGRHPAWADADGATWIVALASAPGPPDATPAVWILSPSYPDGLEVPGPENTGNFLLSPDGETLYAYTSERLSGPGTVWETPLGASPDWQPGAEGVTPLPTPMMFFPEG
jgi:hypothetical protein